MITIKKEDLIGYILLASILLGAIGYELYDSGNELTCRTNKPTGWEITEDYGAFVEATCPYKSKDSVIAYCKSDFRSTPSYERYGCSEVSLYELPEKIPPPTTKNKFVCVAERYGGCKRV